MQNCGTSDHVQRPLDESERADFLCGHGKRLHQAQQQQGKHSIHGKRRGIAQPGRFSQAAALHILETMWQRVKRTTSRRLGVANQIQCKTKHAGTSKLPASQCCLPMKLAARLQMSSSWTSTFHG